MSTVPYDYIVLTAAITRPDLHSCVFPGYLRLIGPARVKWLINVDDVGTGQSVDGTINNLKRLLTAPNISVEFLRATESGCFFQAARRLALRAGELLAICRTGIVWLEDDWQLGARSRAEEAMSRFRLRVARDRSGKGLRYCPGNLQAKQAMLAREAVQPSGLWFVSLVPRGRVSFNPGIWSKGLFERGMLQRLSNHPADQMDDPETLCADPWNNADAFRQLALFIDPLFQDVGRLWSTARGLAKWEKGTSDLARRGAVTYVDSSNHRAVDSKLLARLAGWVEMPGGAFGIGLPLIGRIVLRDGRLTAGLFAFPYLTLELVPRGETAADVYLQRMHGWSRTYPYKKMNARVVWRVDREVRLEVQTRNGSFTAKLSPSIPSRALWMTPLQASAGVISYVMSLIPRLLRLDADTKS